MSAHQFVAILMLLNNNVIYLHTSPAINCMQTLCQSYKLTISLAIVTAKVSI